MPHKQRGVRARNNIVDARDEFSRVIVDGREHEYLPVREAVACTGLSVSRFYAHAKRLSWVSYKRWNMRGAYYLRADVEHLANTHTRWQHDC